tara:strand:+ start:333 stop:491 length:159 start_codon:yes stop_codon:yes gene_type:complete
MNRAKLIEFILDFSSNEYTTKKQCIQLAKMSKNKLRIKVININNYLIASKID